MWAGIAVGFIVGVFVGIVIMGLAAAGFPMSPDDEARLLDEQMEEIRKKGQR